MGPGEPADAGVSAFVTTRPFVSHSGVFEAFGRADALLLFEAPGYYAEFSYAAKVFDYILTGKPVLALIEAGGNTARLLESLEVAYLATPGDVAGFTAALSRVLATKGAPPRAIDPTVEPLRSFDRRHLVSRLAATLDATVEHPNR